MKFAFIKEHRGRFGTGFLCKKLKVSSSGFYAWCKRGPSKRKVNDEQLKVLIRVAFDESRQTYGSPRIHEELKEDDVICSQKRIERLMREEGLSATTKRPFKRTTISDDSPPAPNLVQRKFNAKKPDELWVTDITYVWTTAGWLYLFAIIDVFSRRIVGYTIKETLETDGALEALERAVKARRPTLGLVHHSDRGSQYTDKRYVKALNAIGAKQSMSRAGNCYDNAVAESFFATLKKECVYRNTWERKWQARLAISDYIDNFYNPRRRHSSINFASPIEFELNYKRRRKAV